MERSPTRKTVTGFRLPASDLAMLDAYAAQLAAERPGLHVTRTDVLMVLYRAGAKALGVAPSSEAPEQG